MAFFPAAPKRSKTFTRPKVEVKPSVHQLIGEKGKEYQTKCRKTITFRHLVTGWQSEVTCEECLSG